MFDFFVSYGLTVSSKVVLVASGSSFAIKASLAFSLLLSVLSIVTVVVSGYYRIAIFSFSDFFASPPGFVHLVSSPNCWFIYSL